MNVELHNFGFTFQKTYSSNPENVKKDSPTHGHEIHEYGFETSPDNKNIKVVSNIYIPLSKFDKNAANNSYYLFVNTSEIKLFGVEKMTSTIIAETIQGHLSRVHPIIGHSTIELGLGFGITIPSLSKLILMVESKINI